MTNNHRPNCAGCPECNASYRRTMRGDSFVFAFGGLKTRADAMRVAQDMHRSLSEFERAETPLANYLQEAEAVWESRHVQQPIGSFASPDGYGLRAAQAERLVAMQAPPIDGPSRWTPPNPYVTKEAR